MGESEKEPYKLLKILGCIFFIPFIPLIMISVVPFGLCVNLGIKIRDERLFRNLKSRQRVMDWGEVDKHLDAGEGTLIIEQANKSGLRFWWTPDDLFAISPAPPPVDLDDMDLGYISGRSSNPFVVWCQVNYLSVETGKAFLTRFNQSNLPRGPVEPAFFQNLYPRAKIALTLLTRRRD